MQINSLYSGGIITNYYCSSRCGHCLYACSPKWKKEYITRENAAIAIQKILSLGCHSIHIGGGEPMLDIDGLIDVAEVAVEMGMHIEYVETNSSWFRNEREAVEKLRILKNHGINQLLVSISPFHNEHIPFNKVKGVLRACRKSSMQVFPWIMDFYSDIDSFNDQKPHSKDEYADKYGSDYFRNIPARYWTHYGGRAVYSFKKLFSLNPLNEILNATGCNELSDTSHFHIDLFKNYVPGLCSGMAIKIEDLGGVLDKEHYPFINMLFQGGIKRFCDYAKEEYNFIPEKSYLNKCHLCNDIRIFLIKGQKLDSIELQPIEYYENIEID